jgi:gamma-glutamylcyclotransferase
MNPGRFMAYFAYGSNLSPRRMAERTGSAFSLGVCHLRDHRLAFNKRALRTPGGVFANIVASPGDTVWGVAYRCTPQALQALDLAEGVAGGHYQRRAVQVVTLVGGSLPALTYVAGPDFLCAEGEPATDYLHHIVSGARQHGLPAAYVLTLAERVPKEVPTEGRARVQGPQRTSPGGRIEGTPPGPRRSGSTGQALK